MSDHRSRVTLARCGVPLFSAMALLSGRGLGGGGGVQEGLQETLELVYKGIKNEGEALLLHQGTVLQLRPYPRRTPLKKVRPAAACLTYRNLETS